LFYIIYDFFNKPYLSESFFSVSSHCLKGQLHQFEMCLSSMKRKVWIRRGAAATS
jgi:hypothetical protein